jgi:acyl-coenzyme A thioesterase PaaI-like protein
MTQSFVDTLGVHARTADDGTAHLELDATEQHLNEAVHLRAGKPGRLAVVGRVSKQGEHLTVCEADVEQEGRTLVHAVATFAVLHT